MNLPQRISSQKERLETRFVPHPLLMNKHLMTIVPGFIPRSFSRFRRTGTPRWFELNDQNKLLGYSHFHKNKNKTAVVILHGLEGSSESPHVLGIANKLCASELNVLRLNMRNCGGTLAHSRSLYNAGMWEDLRFVMQSLQKQNGFDDFILVGYSLGGNLILNTAAHHKETFGYSIRGVCTVSPSIDLAEAVKTIELPCNHIYQNWFLRSMKARLIAKSRHFPEIYDASPLKSITTIREFDDRFTAPDGGYGTAERYYREASAINRLKEIRTQVFMLAAEDDPFVPIATFHKIKLSCPEIELIITEHGGHGGFFQKHRETEPFYDHFWAENRVVDFIRHITEN